MGKPKRGRPPKFKGKNGFGKKTLELQVRENDCPDGDVKKELKRKRGRPPKVLANAVSIKEECTIEGGGSYCSDGDVSKESKPTRPKVLGNGVSVKEELTIEAVEIDRFPEDVSKESKPKPKRGRPRKVQENGGLEKKVRGNDVSVKEVFTIEAVEIDRIAEDASKESKPRRGRPRKVQVNGGLEKKQIKVEVEEESDRPNVGGIKKSNHYRGRGRPKKGKKTQGVEKEGVIRKRGRPVKLQGDGKGLKGRLMDGRKKVGGLRSGRMKLRGSPTFNMPSNTSRSEKRPIVRPKEKGVKKAGDEGDQRRPSEAKQAVRERIVNLLKAAGWTVDYRPRINREYLDAVYVNPEGRTHWSVTLAYRVLKNCYENGDSKICPDGFVFTPIPEEDLSILNRVVTKVRADKGKPKGVDDGQVIKKMNKRKRKWKENEKKKKQKLLKRKLSLHEEENSDGTFHRGTQVSSRKRKLQQTQKRKRYALLARNSMNGAESDEHGYVLYDGKRTLLSWMIDSGTVPQDGKVECLIQKRTRTREIKCGRITRDGIQCNCCSDVFTIAEFVTHVGSKLHQPFLNICLDTGVPLLQCLLDAWNNQQESERKGFHFVDFGGEDPNDDTCAICGDGGDLICCDSCPSTFHQSCLDIEAFPSGNWNCVYCTCKYCGMVGNAHQRGKDEDKNPTVLTCQLCEEKYHEPCIQPMDAFDDDSSRAFFCGKRCKELFHRLQMLVGVKHELPEGFSWTLVQRFDIDSDVCLSEAYQKVESNSKLAVALSVMDECFLPLVDHRSGINLIHNIVYNFWSNFTRLNYSGFYTAILERQDEIIAAASVRIHGNLLAEMPFIGTRYAYRRQGMCRRLLSAIESALSSLNVEKLVIPAVPEVRETWTSAFGFEPLESACKPKMRQMNMMVFPGVDMLQKSLLTHITEEQMAGEVSSKSGEKCSVVFDLNVSAETPEPETDERNDKRTAFGSTTLLPDGTLEHTSDIMAETINLMESATASSPYIPAPKGKEQLELDSKSIYSEEKTDDSIVKQNLDSKHEGTLEHTSDIMAETINLPESATASSPCIPAPEGKEQLELDSKSIYSEEKTDDSIVKQNLDSKHEGTLEHTSDIMAETINLPESATASSPCIPAPEGKEQLELDSKSIYSEEKTDDSIVKQNLDSKHEGTLEHTFDIMAETINLPESATASSPCIPAPEGKEQLELDSKSIYSEEKTDDSIVKQNLDSKHKGSLEHTSDIMAETINLPESATASSPCIPAPEGKKQLELDSKSIYSEEKTDDSIVKQNLDSKHEGTLEHTFDIMAETINLPESATASSPCIPAPEGKEQLELDSKSIYSEEKTDYSIVKQNLDSKHEGSLEHTSDIMAETIHLPESATASSPCIPAPEGKKQLELDSKSIFLEEKTDDSIVKQNLDSKHEGSVKLTDNIVTDNEVAVRVHVSKDAAKDINNSLDVTVQMSEDAIDATNQTSPTTQCVQHAANGHYDAASNVGSPLRGDTRDAPGEVSATVDVSCHTYEVCNDTSRKGNLQQCMTEVVSAASEVAMNNIHDQRKINCSTL